MRNNYENHLTEREKEIIDRVYDVYHRTMAENGIFLAGDDRAEKVVEVMAAHIVESREDDDDPSKVKWL